MSWSIGQESITPELMEQVYAAAAANHAETGIPGTRLRSLSDLQAVYAGLERACALLVHVARAEDALILGYSAMLLVPQLDTGESVASQLALWVRPTQRGGLLPSRLIRASDAALEARGVRVVFRQSSVRRPCTGLLEHLGYAEAETVFLRRLADGHRSGDSGAAGAESGDGLQRDRGRA